MIARSWHGAVPAAKGDMYLDRMRKVALSDYKSIAGSRGAYCLNDYQVAKYYDFDRSFLIELEPYVRHCTVYDE